MTLNMNEKIKRVSTIERLGGGFADGEQVYDTNLSMMYQYDKKKGWMEVFPYMPFPCSHLWYPYYTYKEICTNDGDARHIVKEVFCQKCLKIVEIKENTYETL